MKTHTQTWQQLIQIYTHTCIISLSNVSAHTPLVVLHHKKHMHTHTHTLTNTSIYPGQLLSQSVGSLVRGNSSGADGKAAECLAAAAEGSPSMAPAASSHPHTLAHTYTHMLSATLSANPSSPPTPPSLQRLEHDCPFSSGRGEEEMRRDNSLILPRGNIQ